MISVLLQLDDFRESEIRLFHSTSKKVGLLNIIFGQHFQCYKTFLILSKNMIFCRDILNKVRQYSGNFTKVQESRGAWSCLPFIKISNQFNFCNSCNYWINHCTVSNASKPFLSPLLKRPFVPPWKFIIWIYVTFDLRFLSLKWW